MREYNTSELFELCKTYAGWAFCNQSRLEGLSHEQVKELFEREILKIK